jgi:D-sedoheptulose 7-phosphate isomerase
MSMNRIQEAINQSIGVKQLLLTDDAIMQAISQAINTTVAALRSGHKILFCGNGGSAADAQHLAAELSGRFYKDRSPLYAEALHVNTSYLTAVGNDYGFDQVYSRLVEAKGRPGDVLFCLSTSGNSANVINAATQAHRQGMRVIGMTGQSGGKLREHCDVLINVPSTDTPRIQETHILVGHIICELAESEIFSAGA